MFLIQILNNGQYAIFIKCRGLIYALFNNAVSISVLELLFPLYNL